MDRGGVKVCELGATSFTDSDHPVRGPDLKLSPRRTPARRASHSLSHERRRTCAQGTRNRATTPYRFACLEGPPPQARAWRYQSQRSTGPRRNDALAAAPFMFQRAPTLPLHERRGTCTQGTRNRATNPYKLACHKEPPRTRLGVTSPGAARAPLAILSSTTAPHIFCPRIGTSADRVTLQRVYERTWTRTQDTHVNMQPPYVRAFRAGIGTAIEGYPGTTYREGLRGKFVNLISKIGFRITIPIGPDALTQRPPARTPRPAGRTCGC